MTTFFLKNLHGLSCEVANPAGLRCAVAMSASELLRLPAFKLSRLNCEVAMLFVKYRSCQGLSCEMAMFVCNI